MPHLSTGGMPQYTYDLMRKIKNDVDVYCVEHSMVSPHFVVQRNRIIELLGDKFFCLGDDKEELFKIIDKVKPDIIHLQEVPEYFLDQKTSSKLYSTNRDYLIVETSHDSSFPVLSKRYFPDHFALISKYQETEFSKLEIPIDFIEADIEYKQRQDRTEGLTKLGLDPNLKHVLNVGLFTPRKNQAEAIEYARALQNYPIQFHFVGNQADNFADYWRPLLQNLPPNVKIWGERSDVDNFYSCMDLMLFTSRGTGNDKETSPLVIRESIGNHLPSLIYNLPVYLNMYDKYKTINYLTEDMNTNIEYILKNVNLDNQQELTHKIEPESFRIDYDSSDNKVFITSLNDVRDVLVSIRDIDSTAVIWSVKYDYLPANSTYWVIPTPKSYMDFEKDPYFGGLTVEIYKDNNVIYTKDFRIKTPIVTKSKLTIKNNTEPVFINYNEFFVQRIYDKFLKDNKYKTVVDVGANVGLWVEYIKSVSDVETVYAIEPNKKALKILNDSFDNSVTIVDSALTDKDGEIDFFISSENSTISSIVNHGSLDSNYKVNAISFKTFVKNYNIEKIDLLKVDIETGEYDLFESMDQNDFSKIENILVEFHTIAGRTFEKDTNRLIEIMKQFGYECDVNKLHNHGGFIFASKNKKEINPLNSSIQKIYDENPCESKRGLASFVNTLHPNGIGVEIGVLRGEYSKIILDRWKNGTLYLVDTWRHIDEYIDLNGRDNQYHYDCMVETAKNIVDHENRAHMIRMDSVQSANLFPDEFFDFIFIDADHSYEAVVRDIEAWWPKIKKGGIFAGDDFIPEDGDIWLINNADGSREFAGKFGVRKAVTEFGIKNNVKIYSTTSEPYWKQWYTFKPF